MKTVYNPKEATYILIRSIYADLVVLPTTDGGSAQASATISASDTMSRSGTYTAGADKLSLTGSFVTLDINGAVSGGNGAAQTLDYKITNDLLIISQDRTDTLRRGDTTTVVTIQTVSNWAKR